MKPTEPGDRANTETTSPVRIVREPPRARESVKAPPSAPPVLPRAFVLRYLSGPRAGQEQEIVIDPSRELVFGRRDADVTLAEDLVSRRHARLSVEEGRLVLRDLGSTNGTFVNGERISHVDLRLGDRVILGTTIARLVDRVAGPGELQITVERMRHSASTMAGRIEEVPVVDLLQLFSNGRKTGTLWVNAAEVGEIALRGGRIAQVTIPARPGLSPRKALARLLRLETGAFEFSPGAADDRPLPAELDEPTELLLIDSLRLNDELAAMAPQLPPGRSTLALARPLPGRLRALDGDALDILQLAHEHGTFERVVEYAAAPEPDAARAVVRLVGLGFLEVRA